MATTERKQEKAAQPSRDGGRDATPRLTWASKPATVERVALPFQVVETINESRATREAESGSLFGASGNGRTATAWRNKLIWGDNKLIAASLLQEFAGQVNLVYIDPPFDTGTDFSFRVSVGDEQITKEPSILEEHAYSDTWGSGRASYMRMMYERIALISELLAEGGSFFLHCAPNVSHYLKVICDEVFAPEFFQNEVIWQRTISKSLMSRRLPNNHDVILVYRKGVGGTWNEDEVFEPYDEEALDEKTTSKYSHRDDEGRIYRLDNLVNPNSNRPNLEYEFLGVRRVWRWTKERMEEAYQAGLVVQTRPGAVPQLKRFLDEQRGRSIGDVWTTIPPINSQARERVGYATQKPLALIERIIKLASDEEDLVVDLFGGSGTTAVAAEQLRRRWIVADLGRFAIHTTRKRLLDVPNCSPFEILNLGAYERQHWQEAVSGGEIDAYVKFILSLYDAERVQGYRLLHGKKSNRLVHVGAVDAPVTIDEVDEVMDELAANDLRALDVLGWEWEMGLHDVVTERARRRGLDLACRQIPREVMKAELDDEVRFFELAYLDLEVDRQGRSVRVQLRDFVIPSEELIPDVVRSKITQWSDYIDYWSVDFNFRDDTFHNEWQTYRTREEPKLATESDWHDYEEPGRYPIVIKVIDIFGNDTTKLAEVQIK